MPSCLQRGLQSRGFPPRFPLLQSYLHADVLRALPSAPWAVAIVLHLSALYEPWVMVDRHAASWHDVRFRGYGWDKIVFISALNASRFDFQVHPSAYLVHRNHPHTAASATFFAFYLRDQKKRSPEGVRIHTYNMEMYGKAKYSMDAGTFVPVLDQATVNCRQKLPWWKQPAAS